MSVLLAPGRLFANSITFIYTDSSYKKTFCVKVNACLITIQPSEPLTHLEQRCI